MQKFSKLVILKQKDILYLFIYIKNLYKQLQSFFIDNDK